MRPRRKDWLSNAALEEICRTGLPNYDPWALAGDCTFDHDAARRVIYYFTDVLRHTEGHHAGKAFVLVRFQQAALGNLFGWKRPDGRRRYTECLWYTAKKNGKTAICSGVALYMLGSDGEVGAKVFSAAASREQAALVFEPAAAMVRRNPRLAARLRVYGAAGGGQRRAIVLKRNPTSSYVVLSADADTADGKNPHCALIDEVHRHPDGELADVLVKSSVGRRQPIAIYASTADYNRDSPCNRLLQRARNVCANKGDPLKPGFEQAFLPVLFEAQPEDDWTKPETWRKANPNLGITVFEDALAREAAKAVGNPSEVNSFKRLHCNIVTDTEKAAFDMRLWDACAPEGVRGPAPDPRALRKAYDDLLASLKGKRCFGGLDLASTNDLTAFELWFPDEAAVLSWFWVPGDTARKRELEHHVPYTAWIRDGWLEETDGNVCDYDRVEKRAAQIVQAYGFRRCAYDRFGAADMVQRMDKDGLKVLRFGQGHLSMSAPCKDLEMRVGRGRIRHGGHPVLRWCISNVVWNYDPAGNIKIDKEKATEKVDGAVALAMAIGASMLDDTPRQSVYETRGPIVA